MDIEGVGHVLQALSRDRIATVTKEELVAAFRDDGIADLEGMASHILKRLRHDIDMERSEPRWIDFQALSRRTTPEVARGIVHHIPQVPFTLDGVSYEPNDIVRFNGQPLLFVPVTTNGNESMQVFSEEAAQVVANYFNVRQVVSAIGVRDIPGLGSNVPGRPPGQSPQPGDPDYNQPTIGGCGGTTGIPCGQSSTPGTPPAKAPSPPAPPRPFPATVNQVQMFDGGLYTGNWFWCARNFMWTDLTQVSRGGIFGGDWNDEVFSISSTNTWCLYAENTNLDGSRLLLRPNMPIENLVPWGWQNRISSLWNYDLT